MEKVCGYISNDFEKLETPDGKQVGRVQIVSSWKPIKRSWIGTRMYAIRVKTPQGVYSGRTWGEGMFFSGKKMKGS